jgi:predicted nucleic acid-binding protein
MIQIFTDTDILIDFITGRQPFSKDAARLFDLMEKGGIRAYASSLSFSNLYYLLRRIHPHKRVVNKLEELADFLSIINVDERIIKTALKSSFKDFEDAIQCYAAQSVKKIRVIVTRNIKDFRGAELPVMTPVTFLRTYQFSTESLPT